MEINQTLELHIAQKSAEQLANQNADTNLQLARAIAEAKVMQEALEATKASEQKAVGFLREIVGVYQLQQPITTSLDPTPFETQVLDTITWLKGLPPVMESEKSDPQN